MISTSASCHMLMRRPCRIRMALAREIEHADDNLMIDPDVDAISVDSFSE